MFHLTPDKLVSKFCLCLLALVSNTGKTPILKKWVFCGLLELKHIALGVRRQAMGSRLASADCIARKWNLYPG
jgi:hypothetical protein